MSSQRIILPATGGGLTLMALVYNRFFLAMAGILLLILIYVILKTLRGEMALRKEEKKTSR
ncbi:MAG: hypothetical protein GX493_05300 [Firmicutes bacterium]|nr:hypothetical protein [Bacillota bacterium]